MDDREPGGDSRQRLHQYSVLVVVEQIHIQVTECEWRQIGRETWLMVASGRREREGGNDEEWEGVVNCWRSEEDGGVGEEDGGVGGGWLSGRRMVEWERRRNCSYHTLNTSPSPLPYTTTIITTPSPFPYTPDCSHHTPNTSPSPLPYTTTIITIPSLLLYTRLFPSPSPPLPSFTPDCSHHTTSPQPLLYTRLFPSPSPPLPPPSPPPPAFPSSFTPNS
ncbi:hypothetical protein Pcinc_031401 [Petrolisthes cinctipes]|uniref:Uncharacterized protein n=1 Tax=Petrolisthes cinctipes TaxID=88211 RepID=A0AAE1K4X3_PETCI|nr:hypothetical protein Pcinc_031401 [Petrolisthes cinctipes]